MESLRACPASDPHVGGSTDCPRAPSLYVRLCSWWRDRYLLKLSREYSYTLQQLWAVTKVELKK